MKRFLALILTAVVLITLCSCEVLEQLEDSIKHTLRTVQPIAPAETLNPYYEVEPRDVSYNEGYTPVQSRYSYNSLPLEGEKSLYNELVKAYYDISPIKNEELGLYPMPEIKLDGVSLTEAQVRTAMKAVTDDYPEIFWPGGTVGYYSDSSMTIVQPYSRFSAQEVDSHIEAVRKAAEEFYSSVPNALLPYELEKRVHDYLLENVKYDDSVKVNDLEDNDPDIYSVYGALVEHNAVCEGYTRSFQLLMNGLGIDCVSVTGRGENELHIWNCVKLGSDWYSVDATWDDQEEKYARYLYFNVTDEYMKRDHEYFPLFSTLSEGEINGSEGECSADIMNLFIPACTDASMSYYYRETPHLKDFEADELRSRLLSAAENKVEIFCFYIESNMDYQDTIDQLFTYSPQYFFDYVDNVNYNLKDYSIDSSNLGYYTLDQHRAAAVMLKYY